VKADWRREIFERVTQPRPKGEELSQPPPPPSLIKRKTWSRKRRGQEPEPDWGSLDPEKGATFQVGSRSEALRLQGWFLKWRRGTGQVELGTHIERGPGGWRFDLVRLDKWAAEWYDEEEP